MFLTQAKRLLGWNPKHTITDDLAEYFEGYKAAGKVETEPDFIQVRADEVKLVHVFRGPFDLNICVLVGAEGSR